MENISHQTQSPSSKKDLVYDLGPANSYDQIAGEALLTGTFFRDERLLEQSQQLAQMIQAVDYHSDKFASVIALSQDIRHRLQKLKNSFYMSIDSIDDWTDRDFDGWKFILEKYRDTYQICFDKWYPGNYDFKQRFSPLQKHLEQYLDLYFGLDDEENPCQLSTINRSEDFYDRDDRLVKRIIQHIHQDGYMGWRINYCFHTDSFDQSEIKKVWQKLKNLADTFPDR